MIISLIFFIVIIKLMRDQTKSTRKRNIECLIEWITTLQWDSSSFYFVFMYWLPNCDVVAKSLTLKFLSVTLRYSEAKFTLNETLHLLPSYLNAFISFTLQVPGRILLEFFTQSILKTSFYIFQPLISKIIRFGTWEKVIFYIICVHIIKQQNH